MPDRLIRSFRFLAALSALLLAPTAAQSLELFEGNWGYDGNWLHVLDAPAMSDRVYWQDLGGDLTYRAQCASDLTFSEPSLVLDEGGFVDNYLVPDLGPGAYVFRAREVHTSGVEGDWSDAGTLDVFEDVEAPSAAILHPVDGQTFTPGDAIRIEVEVSDDTVLHLARLTVDGEYVMTLGLKAEDGKVRASLGEARVVSFDVPAPSKGGNGRVEISVAVSDVTYKSVTRSVTIQTGKASTEKAGGRNSSGPKGRKK